LCNLKRLPQRVPRGRGSPHSLLLVSLPPPPKRGPALPGRFEATRPLTDAGNHPVGRAQCRQGADGKKKRKNIGRARTEELAVNPSLPPQGIEARAKPGRRGDQKQTTLESRKADPPIPCYTRAFTGTGTRKKPPPSAPRSSDSELYLTTEISPTHPVPRDQWTEPPVFARILSKGMPWAPSRKSRNRKRPGAIKDISRRDG